MPPYLEALISVDAASVEFNDSTLFSDISFNINENDRIALMGKNAEDYGQCAKARGKVSATKDAVIAYFRRNKKLENPEGD